jgi:thiamine biosynthesis lipoprotein
MLDCRRNYEKTEGFFDITLTNFEKIVFIEKTNSILFDKYGMMLDFGGYAKGYALKCMHKKLEEAGIKRALVNFGNSSVLALGTHPFGDSWAICMNDNLSNINDQLTIRINDASLSVSGNTSALKPHIMNPKTTELICGDTVVAIVAEDPVDAEVLSTAWIASGCHNKPDWMSNFNLITSYRIK